MTWLYAAGDTFRLSRLPAISWEVIRAWQSVGDDFVAVDWVEIYHPDRGSWMVWRGDPREDLYCAVRKETPEWDVR